MPIQLIITEPSIGPTDQTTRIARGDHHGFDYSCMFGERDTLGVTFEIAAGDAYMPVIGSPITYYETANATTERIFAGKILERTPHWFASDESRYIHLACVSLESLFDTALAPAKAYLGWTVVAIVTDLVTPIIAKAPTLIQLGSIIAGTVVPSFILDGTSYISDALNQLVAIMNGWAWGVDPATSPLPSFFFRPPESSVVTLTGNLLWDTFEYTQTGADLVTQVRLTAGAGVFPPSCWTFVSAAGQIFTLPFAPGQVQAARLTWGRAPSALLAYLSAIPIPGSTMTIGSITYIFVSVLDNGEQNQILIGATVAANVINMAAAINADQSVGGASYSWPTVENDLANAEIVSSGAFYVWSKKAGVGGNSIGVTSTVVGLTFVGIPTEAYAGHLTGGGYPTPPAIAPQDITLSCINSTDQSNISQPTLLYQAGVQDVTVLIPQLGGSPAVMGFAPDSVPVFWLLEVQYQRLGGSTITLEDSALVDARATIEHSSGQHQRVISVNSAADLASAYQAGKKLLAENSKLPYTLTFDTLLSGFRVYGRLILGIPLPTTTLNAMQWIVHEIQGKYIPGLEDYPEYTVRRTVKAISGSEITQINTYLKFWRGALAGGAGSGPPPPLPIVLAPLAREAITISVPTASVGTDVAEHIPLDKTYEVRQVVVTPKLSPLLLLTGEVFSDGSSLFPFSIPAGATPDAPIVVDVVNWSAAPPMILEAGSIQTIDILSGDGTIDYRGVFTIRMDVLVLGA